jgi:hypothetical protein
MNAFTTSSDITDFPSLSMSAEKINFTGRGRLLFLTKQTIKSLQYSIATLYQKQNQCKTFVPSVKYLFVKF